MTVKQMDDLQMSIGDLLQTVGPAGVLLESPGKPSFAVLPLDDDVLDFLLERSPKFIDECQKIRQRMQCGKFYSHDEVKKLLGSE